VKPKVFLSYANSDKEFADRLSSQLRKVESSLFLDLVNLPHGKQILSGMRSQISSADILVLLLSPNALESEWVQRELEYAVSKELRQRSITVVPLMVRPSRLPEYLSAWTIIDATRDFETAVGKLAKLLEVTPLVQLENLGSSKFEELIGDLLKAY